MGNIHDHRIDITGQDWSGAFRADGDYIAWRHVEPIVEANKTLLEALERIKGTGVFLGAIAQEMMDSAIAKAKGETP